VAAALVAAVSVAEPEEPAAAAVVAAAVAVPSSAAAAAAVVSRDRITALGYLPSASGEPVVGLGSPVWGHKFSLQGGLSS
jgi:hypothetical protein